MCIRDRSSRVRRICVAYEGMERFFPKEKIVLTGNPLRGRFWRNPDLRAEALRHFGLEEGKPVTLVVGGSLGTRTLNEMMKANVDRIVAEGKIQVIWQTGKDYEREMTKFMQGRSDRGIWRGAFIDRMDLAYACLLYTSRISMQGDTIRIRVDRPASAIRFIGQNGTLLAEESGAEAV